MPKPLDWPLKLDPRQILKHPIIYTNYQKMVGGYRARRKFVEDYLPIKHGERLLDIGCGPGDILEFLPDVDYLGIDIDQDYIEKANNKYGKKASFQCTKIKDLKLEPLHTFDYVIATGVLHHLNTDESEQFFELAQRALKPNGKLLTLDGVYIENQNKISKFLLDNDRGQFIRTTEGYKELAVSRFRNIKTTIEEDYFHIPYTLLIMECIAE